MARYKDMWELTRPLRGMGGSNAVRARTAHVARRTLNRAAQIYEERFAHLLDGVQATLELCHMIGWKAGEGQQMPLRGGVLARRFAGQGVKSDALARRKGMQAFMQITVYPQTLQIDFQCFTK